ncbi:RCC1 domain-containing protein [Myxococcus xanthus]|uniref:RCC1 domain-containing protein n=1 Tax=Myxococcus xanthus TaxID=34 RepID=UPI0011644A54|nr:hypothetical protein [Myxococcus xanthus]QDF06877.1 hypothetical protein BHS04_27360 [Myxococcus xanthus]
MQVPGVTGAIAVAAGGYHSLALLSDNTLRAWGKNEDRQLGDGTNTDRHTAVQVSGLTGVTSVFASGGHSLVLRNDQAVWVFGSDMFGQLRDGNTPSSHGPVQVSLP